MRIVLTKSFSPYDNLALEEIILKDEDIKDDILLLYINKNTIVIGRNQNAHEEVNADFVKANKVNIIRRISGGGAVYQDEGNLSFSFITKKQPGSYQKFLIPIIDFLKSLNIDAQFHGKNDLLANGAKVSGNAQYIYKDRMFHHGTLLFNVNLDVLAKAIKPNPLKLQSKAIKSIRQRVGNIKDMLDEEMDNKEFAQRLVDFFIDKYNASWWDVSNYKVDKVKALTKIRESYDWNYRKNPIFTFKNEMRFAGGTISVFINVVNDTIENIEFIGDFLSQTNIEDFEQKFIGLPYNKQKISQIIDQEKKWTIYFGKLTKDDLKKLLGVNNE